MPLSELDQLGIRDDITDYSFEDNLYAYLEEDCDLVTFLEAKEREHGNEYYVEEESFNVFVNEFPLNEE